MASNKWVLSHFLEPIMMLQIIRTAFLNLEKCDKAFPIIFLFRKIQVFQSADEETQGGTWSIPVWTPHQAEGTNATALAPALWVKYLPKLTLLGMILPGQEQLLLWATCPLLQTATSQPIANISVLIVDADSPVRAGVPVVHTDY